MKTSPARLVIQTSAFLRKELVDILRQPRLLLMMVFGPLLVMVAFGVGYGDKIEPLRTVFVVPARSVFAGEVERYVDDLGSAVKLEGVVDDPAVGERMLANDQADVVVEFPADPLSTVLAGSQAVLRVRHTRLDPVEQTAINFATTVAVDRINAHILAEIVRRGQEQVGPASAAVRDTSVAADGLTKAADSSDPTQWQTARTSLVSAVDRLDESLRTSSVVSARLGEGTAGVAAAVAGLRAAVEALPEQPSNDAATLAALAQIHSLVGPLAQQIQPWITADPNLLVQPIRGVSEVAIGGVDDVSDWYAPAAVVLVLQQFGVAFGSLSFVRERQLGIDELFRVAPVGAPQTVLGKYLAYVLAGSVIGTVLTVVLVTLLDVPLAGSLGQLAVTMGLVLAASIGLGLLLSLVSMSDAQAVQFTMIVLLASLFFSGFFLAVGNMEGPTRVIPWLLPATYGMALLRGVMLRGSHVDSSMVVGVSIYAGVALVLTLGGAARRMSGSRGGRAHGPG